MMKPQNLQADLFPKTYQADIAVAATENTPARLVHVKLDQRETEHVQAFAADCGLSLDAFVRACVGPGLPAQDHWRGFSALELPFLLLNIERIDPMLLDRLERLDRVQGFGPGISMFEYIQEAVAHRIDADEKNLLFNVETGDPVDKTRLTINLRRAEELVAPTLREQRGEVPRHVALSPRYEERWAQRVPLSPAPSPADSEALIPVGLPLEPLRVTLSPEATTAVLRYHQVTDDAPTDIVNGVLTGEIEHALRYVAKRDEQSWRVTAELIAEATRQREDRVEPPDHDMSGFEHVVVLPLEPAAHALLTATALDGEHGSLEALLRQLCFTECETFVIVNTMEDHAQLKSLFQVSH